jgi:predicted peptidase
MVGLLLLIGIPLIVLVVILLVFVFSRDTRGYQPGLQREVLNPGYRRYTISVPFGYSGDQPTPLILALHYAGHGMPYYGELILQSLIEPAFRELEPIIVAPDCRAKDWTQPESEQLILDLLDTLQDQFNIDPNRILIAGYSLGGSGTWHYAGRYPERFTSAMIMAGRPPDDVLETDWCIPLMAIHGRKDEVAPLQATKEAVLALEEKGVDIELRILENVTHYETHYFVPALRNAIPWLLEKWESEG